jgi:GTP cyclohydrolase III
MALEGYNLLQTYPVYHALKVTNVEVNKYNMWSHNNKFAREFMLTSLASELYEKLQNFKVASNMLEYLEVRFGE